MDLNTQLAQFTGSVKFYKHPTQLIYTDGIQKDPEMRFFQVWYLTRPDSTKLPWLTSKIRGGCIVSCWEDTPTEQDHPKVLKHVEHTDFQLPDIQLYVENKTLLLPSEH
jgi:hypothetical protein